MRLILRLIIAVLIISTACNKPRAKHFVQVPAIKGTDEKIVFKLIKDKNATESWKVERFDHSDYYFPAEFQTRLKASIENCPSCFDMVNDSINEKTLEISITNKTSDYFDISDMNFDGNFDISFTSAATCCDGKNIVKEVWIFDDKTRTFTYNSELSGSCLWDYNDEEKTLVMGWSLGFNDFTSSTYKNVGNSMIEIQREKVEPYNDSVVRIISETRVKDTWQKDTIFENR